MRMLKTELDRSRYVIELAIHPASACVAPRMCGLAYLLRDLCGVFRFGSVELCESSLFVQLRQFPIGLAMS